MGLVGKRILACFVTALGVGLPLLDIAAAAPLAPADPAPKRILILYDEDKDSLPGLARVDRSLRESFRSRMGNGIEITSESLALARFEHAGYDALVEEFYRRKYAASPPDLIVAVLEPSLDFLLRHAGSLFIGTPIVFSGVDASTIKDKALPDNVTGVLVKRTFSPTLELVLRLQPQTRNVFVVGGDSTFDRYLEGLVRRDLERFEGRVGITYLFGLSMDPLLARLSRLPDRSVILYTTVFTDATGRRFVPHEVAASIAAAANAPVYVFLDQFVGLGVVGGNVYSFDTHETYVADMGARILGGASPASLPIREAAAQVDMFDARQLRRWKLDEGKLPPGSIVRFQEQSAWELYRWYIVGAISVVLLQGALIAGLLGARMRQRRAEREAVQERDTLAHVQRITTLGDLSSSLAHEITQPIAAIQLNADAAMRSIGSGRAVDTSDVQEALTDIKVSADHAALVITQLRTLSRKERIEPVALDVKSLIGDVVRLLHSELLSERIELRTVYGKDVPLVLGDPVQLEQVLLNVLKNACEAIGARETGPRSIRIETRQDRPGYVTIEVADSGIGVEVGELERIFEHFVSTKPEGLGMGLAISRSIVKAHGGTIFATSDVDRGLMMHIELLANPA